ncbi:MAG: GGDEF domain-containing protein [Candidatus Zixiibacteriota bacterium]
MAKIATFVKEHWTFVAEIFLFLSLICVLLLIDFDLYLKLASALLSTLFLVGWFLLSFSKQQEKYRLLADAHKQQTGEVQRLSELASDLSKTAFAPDRLPEIAPHLQSFFEEFLKASKFLLFVKKGKSFHQVLASHVASPEPAKVSMKLDSEFLSLLKSKDGIVELTEGELSQLAKAPSTLRSLQKDHGFDSIIPLSTEAGLWGFVLLEAEKEGRNPDDKSVSPLSGLVNFVLNQIALYLERLNHSSRLKDLEKKLNTDTNQSRAEFEVLNSDLKRKIFDLNAVLGLVKSLFSVEEEEELFSSLARMVHEHLGATSTLVMLPQTKDGDLIGTHFFGIDPSKLCGKENDSSLRIEKGTPLYNWIKNEKPIWYLFSMHRLSGEERLLDSLLACGFQIGAKLQIARDRFGVILLSEKASGAKYRPTDLSILAILLNMAIITYKNIVHYRGIEELSYTDSMTELYNYRYFYKRLTEEVLRAKRFDRKLALVILDIDDFKTYNDNYGHQAGDQLLKQLGGLLSRTVRSIDVVSRYGGEEFCVIMPESDSEECLKFMERLRKSIMNFAFKSESGADGEEYIKQEHNITVSLGGAIYPHDARSVDRLIYCADMALLKAKNTDKNRSLMYEEQLVAVKERI